MYNLHLSAEQLAFRDTVREFVAQEVKPIAVSPQRLEAAEQCLPMELLDKASEIGLRTLALSEELGGAGADNLTCCLVTEELAAGDADVAAVLAETSTLGHILFDRLMTPIQRERFLPQFLADHRYHLALADYEPETDSGLGVNYYRPVASEARIRTTATRTASGDWAINGVKGCVANAPVAKLIAVQVRTEADAPGVSTLLVPRETPGLAVREPVDRWYHGACGELVMRDCRVPAGNLLGAAGKSPLNPDVGSSGRGMAPYEALNLGIGRAAHEAAIDYAKLRVQGGRRLIEHQAIGTKLAEIAIRLEVARTAIWQAAWASDHPEAVADRSLADLPLRTIAGVFTSEAVYRVAKDVAECFGAMGVMKDMPLQKYIHDALVCLHSGNGNSDAKLRIAEALAGYRRP